MQKIYSPTHFYMQCGARVLIMRNTRLKEISKLENQLQGDVDKMGTSQSTSSSGTQLPDAQPTPRKTVSRHVATFKKLYQELSAPDETGEQADRDLFRVRKASGLDVHVFNLLLKFNAYNIVYTLHIMCRTVSRGTLVGLI